MSDGAPPPPARPGGGPFFPGTKLAASVRILTDDVQCYEVAHLRLRRHLALVPPGVPRLHVLHLERPRVRGLDQERLEPVVGDERVPVHGQYVSISSPDPRYLK